MKKVIIIICVGILIIAAAACYLRFIYLPKQILDGPGMVYSWLDYELHETYVETNNSSPATMIITEGEIEYTNLQGNSGTLTYSLPEDVDRYGVPEGEVYLQLSSNDYFDYLIYHSETLEEDSRRVSFLTGVSLDEQGSENVVMEFTVSGDASFIPEDYVSTSAAKRMDSGK